MRRNSNAHDTHKRYLPFEGLRVADFTRVWAGPHATVWLSVLGAEVIRIESGRHADSQRVFMPSTGSGSRDTEPDQNPLFVPINFGKKSCTLDLTKPEAIRIAREIISVSDVVAENYSSGVMERFGLDYESVKRIKPDIVMLSASGFGRTGPYKHFVAYAPAIHAFTGTASVTGYVGGPPALTVPGWGDIVSARAGAFALMSALHHRARTGEGQHIDLAMTEVVLSFIAEEVMEFTMNARDRGRRGNQDDIMAPHGCYPCKGEDKWVAIAVSDDNEWRSLCKVMGDPDWGRDDRFADSVSRWQNQDALDELMARWTKNFPTQEVTRLLQRAGVAAGPSQSGADLAEDEQLQNRGFYVGLEQPQVALKRFPGLPITLEDGAVPDYEPAPLFGEHNRYVFNELLGLPQNETAALVSKGVIA